MSSRRLVIAGEIYSPNLGDGVIYECLSYLLQQLDPDVEVVPLDISGRRDWAKTDPHANARLRAIALVQKNLPWLYPYLNLERLQLDYRRHLRMQWSTLLQGAEALLIGGGKLLMDNQLDFPFKLNRLYQLAKMHGLPLHLTALGVGEHWSRTGKRLVEPLVHQAATISLRDARSFHLLQATFGNNKAIVTCDPAIWAGEVYHPNCEQNSAAPIGINVINPLDANTHQPHTQRKSAEDLQHFYLQLASHLVDRNLGIEIFSNGNRRDDVFARQLFSHLQHNGLQTCSLAQRPVYPSELVTMIHRYRGVIASRLHAAILAAALEKPSVGLAWDEKIAAFYAQIGQTEAAFPIQNIEAGEIVNRLVHHLEFKKDKEALHICRQQALLNARLVLNAG